MKFINCNLLKQRWPVGCLFFFAVGCQTKSQYTNYSISRNDSAREEKYFQAAMDSVSLYKKLIHSGDLILRTGKDFTSETMRLLSSKDKTYSHCGIASIEHDSLFVYHSIGGQWNPDQQLRRDPIELFCNPYENRGFGIFRYAFTNSEKEKLIRIVHIYYEQKIKFDMQFDLATDDRMYCSEFVYKSVERASNDSIILPSSTLNHVKFISLDNLFINPYCSEIKRIVFR